MAGRGSGKKSANLRNGTLRQMAEAAVIDAKLSLPFEVWKTRMGRSRRDTSGGYVLDTTSKDPHIGIEICLDVFAVAES